MAAALMWPWYSQVSLWVGPVIMLMVITMFHMVFASRRIVCFPHIAILIAGLQYVLAPWLSFYFPPDDPLFDIGDLPRYFSYATPVVIVTALGWAIGMTGMTKPPRNIVQSTPSLLRDLDFILALGFTCIILQRYFADTNFSFVFLLMSNLRYVSVYARMLCNGPGWVWRLALVMGAEIMFATDQAMFHTLILLALWTFVVWIYCFPPSPRTIVISSIGALLLLPALQEAKWKLREQPYGKASAAFSNGKINRIYLWMTYLAAGVGETVTGRLDRDFLSSAVVRYNQGWIINRIMEHVPQAQPYARGATLRAALYDALLPRFLAPNKAIAGGKLNMEKYAGVKLEENTSMNLGYAGEMYANFGMWAGVVGCGLYAVVLSLLFRLVCRLAFKSPLWWSVMPYIGFLAMKAEEGISEVVNWTFKSIVVIIGVCIVFPAFRRALIHLQLHQSIPIKSSRPRGMHSQDPSAP
jgi:hypothetical protein